MCVCGCEEGRSVLAKKGEESGEGEGWDGQKDLMEGHADGGHVLRPASGEEKERAFLSHGEWEGKTAGTKTEAAEQPPGWLAGNGPAWKRPAVGNGAGEVEEKALHGRHRLDFFFCGQ